MDASAKHPPSDSGAAASMMLRGRGAPAGPLGRFRSAQSVRLCSAGFASQTEVPANKLYMQAIARVDAGDVGQAATLIEAAIDDVAMAPGILDRRDSERERMRRVASDVSLGKAVS